MTQKHKHYDCIVAWADGKEIEFLGASGYWFVVNRPDWSSDTQYRIKPEPKADLVNTFTCIFDDGVERKLRYVFDPYTGEMKSCKVVV